CQAEDGIRDFHVTGVQTCALPICLACIFCQSKPSCRFMFFSKRSRSVLSNSSRCSGGSCLFAFAISSVLRFWYPKLKITIKPKHKRRIFIIFHWYFVAT